MPTIEVQLIESLSAPNLLATSLREREQGNLSIAEAGLVIGMNKFSQYLDQYGQAAFKKEFLRTILLQRDWRRAESLLAGLPDHEIHLYDVLVARAYDEAGLPADAIAWWGNVARHCPANWEEAASYFRRLGKPLPARQTLNSLVAAKLDEPAIHSMIEHGLTYTLGSIDRFFRGSASASKQKAAETLHRLASTSIDKMTRANRKAGGIPHISHRIWLTDKANPSEPPEAYVNRYIDNLRDGFSPSWRHVVWVQDETLTPRMMRQLTASGKHIEVKSIYKGDLDLSAINLIDRYIAEKKFALAADVTKIACLHKWGGVYCDFGVIFNTIIDDIVFPFDYVFHLWHALFFQLSLIAMTPNNPISSIYMQMIRNPGIIPRYVFDQKLTGNSDLTLVSGGAISIIFFLLSSEHINACLLVSNRHVIAHSAQQSWYRPVGPSGGSTGGVMTVDTEPTLAQEAIWSGKEPIFFGYPAD